MTSAAFTKMVLSFDCTMNHSHFDRVAFKVVGKRIFATLLEEKSLANIKLSPSEQLIFCSMSKAISPVPNKWGEQGWTTFEIKNVENNIILEALNSAYQDIVKKKNA